MQAPTRSPRTSPRTPRQLGEADAKAQRRAARQAEPAWRLMRRPGDRSATGRRHIMEWEASR